MSAAVSRSIGRRGGNDPRYAGLLVVVLLLWQAVGSWTEGMAITGPLTTFAYAGRLVLTAAFWGQVWATLAAFLLAFVLSAVCGLLLGLGARGAAASPAT